jgi:hypothetical protein
MNTLDFPKESAAWKCMSNSIEHLGKQSKFDRCKNYLYSIENEVKETGVRLYG